MALPYATEVQAKAFASKETDKLKEQLINGEIPLPGGGGNILNERFFKTTSSIDFDSIGLGALKSQLQYFYTELPDYHIIGKGFSANVAILEGGSPASTENTFLFNLPDGGLADEGTYTCSGYEISNLISYIKGEVESLDIYYCEINITEDVETGDLFINMTAELQS